MVYTHTGKLYYVCLLVKVLEARFGEHPPLLDPLTHPVQCLLQYLTLTLSYRKHICKSV